MAEVSQASAVSESVRGGLRDIRGRRRRYHLAAALGVPAFGALALVSSAFGPPPSWLAYAAWGALAAGWLGLTYRLEGRVVDARCPRCGGLFHARRWRGIELRGIFLRSCQHCGLRLRPGRAGDADF